MAKTLIGPRLRKLRQDNGLTQAVMAKALGVSPAYVNLLENNQRSLSVQMLVAISETYGVDWRELTQDDSARILSELRSAFNDPTFADDTPDLSELRGAIDHAPRFVDQFLKLHSAHRRALDIITKFGGQEGGDALMGSTPDNVIHDFYSRHQNHFPALEDAAEAARGAIPNAPESMFVDLRDALKSRHGITTRVLAVDQMSAALRLYDADTRMLSLSQALSFENRAFQLAHVLALVEHRDLIDGLALAGGIDTAPALPRLRVELANYFAAAFMLPYAAFLSMAENVLYDLDRLAASFGATFEQVCQRLTTLNRDGARGVPFFFLRVDRAGNVTKRFNATAMQLAEHGGACPVWTIHSAFYTPGVIQPQLVEMPDGARYFTISRTVHRPVFSEDTQDRRLVLAMGCSAEYADRIGYARQFRLEDAGLYSPIGINCHVCPRQACSQRAHQPLLVDLPIDANRRGSTRHES